MARRKDPPPVFAPAVYPERDALLQAIADNPDDDLPRLVYADWQDEHGQPEHAELIRVECERKRLTMWSGRVLQKALLARAIELLNSPTLANLRTAAGGVVGGLDRGFVPVHDISIGGPPNTPPIWNTLGPDPEDGPASVPWDKVLGLRAMASRAASVDWIGNVFHRPWFQRVTIVWFQFAVFDPGRADRSAGSPQLGSLRKLVFDGSVVAPDALASLVLASGANRLVSVALSRTNRVTPRRDDQARDPDAFAGALRQIVLAAAGGRLRSVYVRTEDWGDPAGRALAEAPPSFRPVRLRYDRHRLSPDVQAALKDRFGPAISLYG